MLSKDKIVAIIRRIEMTPERMLPPGGVNKFQGIKALCAQAEAGGQKLYRLSIGQPSGPALASARVAASQAVLSKLEPMHEYQDNGSPGVLDFARRFIMAHFSAEIAMDMRGLSFLPIPGIKPMLMLIPLACNCTKEDILVLTMTNPGYPTPADQCHYLGVKNHPLRINAENKFLFSVKEAFDERADLWMMNYPHNPSGQIATKEFWEEVCTYCEKYHIRLFNDAAYSALTHDASACSLSEVATHFPNLSWAEAFSASKLIGNGTGWRIGAMAGSPDFIADIAEIKGNADSGFFAPAAAGVLVALENDQNGIAACRNIYAERIEMLTNMLGLEFGLRLAVEPKAGFFTLWEAPKRAFGQDIENAEMFNNLMIEKTGIVGVPFGDYIRYAVTSPVDSPEWQEAIRSGFNQACIEY